MGNYFENQKNRKQNKEIIHYLKPLGDKDFKEESYIIEYGVTIIKVMGKRQEKYIIGFWEGLQEKKIIRSLTQEGIPNKRKEVLYNCNQ